MTNVLFRDKPILLRFSTRQDVGQSEQRFKLLELRSAGFPVFHRQLMSTTGAQRVATVQNVLANIQQRTHGTQSLMLAENMRIGCHQTLCNGMSSFASHRGTFRILRVRFTANLETSFLNECAS